MDGRQCLSLQAHARLGIVEEFDTGFFQRGNNPAKCLRPRGDRPVEAFHASYGSKRHSRFFGKLPLSPAQKAARRPYVSATYNDQEKKLTRLNR